VPEAEQERGPEDADPERADRNHRQEPVLPSTVDTSR
jgi:hypothetical protein